MAAGDSEVLAVVTTGLFTGAAAYCSIVDGPAMLSMKPDTALEYWQAFFPNAAKLQAALAIISATSSYLSYRKKGNADTKQFWAASGLLMTFMLPYTGIVMMPKVNYPLMAGEAVAKSPEWKASKLKFWCQLHAVRTVAGAAAFLASAVGMSQM